MRDGFKRLFSICLALLFAGCGATLLCLETQTLTKAIPQPRVAHRATLGICPNDSSTPTGLHPLPGSPRHAGRNPVGVNYTTTLPPRVAAARQPWALL